jgi:hypothetical protein
VRAAAVIPARIGARTHDDRHRGHRPLEQIDVQRGTGRLLEAVLAHVADDTDDCQGAEIAVVVAELAPSAPSSGMELTLVCNAQTVLAGDFVVGLLRANSMNVSLTATWTSSAPSVATSEGTGLFVAKSDGQTTLTATYSGRSLSASLTVYLQDVLTASASANGGTFKVGTTATMWLQGSYGVASADFAD